MKYFKDSTDELIANNLNQTNYTNMDKVPLKERSTPSAVKQIYKKFITYVRPIFLKICNNYLFHSKGTHFIKLLYKVIIHGSFFLLNRT